MSQELGLQPKRECCCRSALHRKTTIGRALARVEEPVLPARWHRLTAAEFFPRVHRIFEIANRPPPLLSTTATSSSRRAASRALPFLLTMLDGLESKTAGRICLIMTAMDVGNLPPALVRSGRIELWLETRLPPVEARAAILGDLCGRLPAAVGDVDISAIAAATDGLAGADLKRVVEDGKLLFAYDREKTGKTQPSTTYFLRAVETVRRNKEQYAAAEARARARRPVRPSFFDAMSAMHSFGMAEAPTSFDISFPTIVSHGSGDEP